MEENNLKISLALYIRLEFSYVAKTKALISFAVTAKLICVFVFAYAKSRFSHDAAQLTFATFQAVTVLE